jgi:betaine-aldehyde dehydrogenase
MSPPASSTTASRHKIHGDVIPVPDNAMSLALREPIGVAGQIVPWNLSVVDVDMETGAGNLRRLHGRAETGEQTPADCARNGVEFRRSRLAAGRRQRGHRSGETAGAGACRTPPTSTKIAFTRQC